MLENIQKEIRSLADNLQAKNLSRFFKTGKGEYAEGDLFLGIKVPDTRKVVKRHIDLLSMDETVELLHSAYHEERLAALLILKENYRKGDEGLKKEIFNIYLKNTKYINNWDLVDLTAPGIVGGYLYDKDRSVLYKLAKSKDLWERRIAVLATAYFIDKGETEDILKIAKMLLADKHDLIHKAVGWMLREVGKRCSVETLKTFLDQHIREMPRTMLRYAIEKFPEEERQQILKTK